LAREQCKLAAIVAADVVGYSRLMGRDESGTLARLRKNRSEHLEPVLAKYSGRLVKLTGDGALIEFVSAVDALSAAIEFQQAMAEVNRDHSADTALVFRMGLHLADLILDGLMQVRGARASLHRQRSFFGCIHARTTGPSPVHPPRIQFAEFPRRVHWPAG
jgi:class 3 adenylate cyclase